MWSEQRTSFFLLDLVSDIVQFIYMNSFMYEISSCQLFYNDDSDERLLGERDYQLCQHNIFKKVWLIISCSL